MFCSIIFTVSSYETYVQTSRLRILFSCFISLAFFHSFITLSLILYDTELSHERVKQSFDSLLNRSSSIRGFLLCNTPKYTPKKWNLYNQNGLDFGTKLLYSDQRFIRNILTSSRIKCKSSAHAQLAITCKYILFINSLTRCQLETCDKSPLYIIRETIL